MPEEVVHGHSQAIQSDNKYLIIPEEGMKTIVPCARVGELRLNGTVQDWPFQANRGDIIEFCPVTKAENLTWELEVRFYGMLVVAKVKHELGGRYVLPQDPSGLEEICLEKLVVWEESQDQGEIWDEAKLLADLKNLKVIYGYRPECWSEISAVKGVQEVEIAVAKAPVPSENAQLENFVAADDLQVQEDERKKIDFFASKVQLVKEGEVLARKIPAKPGVPGMDVFGKVYSVATPKDFQFRLKKNVRLSEDGLEVLATCAGRPIRSDERTYMVENVYVLNQDVDLATGSIEFPGDVYIGGNVQDGLRIFAGGMLEIRGSASHAEIRAEKGAKIQQNLIGGKVVIGEKFVVHSELLRSVTELREQLNSCLVRTAELIKSAGVANVKPGLCLKIVLEKQFPELPKVTGRLESFISAHTDDQLITEALLVAIRTAKRFLSGLGPLEPQSLSFLQRVDQALEGFIETLTLEVPEKLSLVVNYIQGATIECGGSFTCQKGTYNSEIRVAGDATIEGVCRGGKLFIGGKASIRELGGSEISTTFVQISPQSRLLVDYCHPNVIIAVGKELIRIEEAYRKLEVYREKGKVEIEKLRAKPL
ncbi:FapA family protein [Desulfosporosinus sp. PR]|uniref:FapA family protein n=1 Tax=Candidatus Desulfosporosinus nitrosoreducens TaxID=3401928 RepID=UPI0027EA73B8|nr:FapA family protein [Desulfosporosinus sp. PR]MDQ7096197.1 FapA family protein [Desulfosporosinus sp. PR]